MSASSPSEPALSVASAGEAAWHRSCRQLHQFHREHGHCDVPPHDPAWQKLAAWTAGQRDLHQRGKLSLARQTALDALGFTWEIERGRRGRADEWDAKWHRRYAELIEFQRQHGHTRVPKTAPGNRVLWHWRQVQREWRRKGILKPERVAQLEAIGFEWHEPDRFARSWDPEWENLWERRFEQLVQFKRRFGHCRVGSRWKENPDLGKWVIRQRTARKRDGVRADRIARLDELGFDWELGRGGGDNLRNLWERRFGELLAFQALTGHTRVPRQPPGSQVLRHWRHVQRDFRRHGQLSADRIARLDAIGFEWHDPERHARSWDPQWDELWERMFQQLVAFKERFGHCAVSSSWKKNLLLGKWVLRQRTADRRHELRPDRRARLDSLGFVWNVHVHGSHAQLWERRYAELRAFLELHGHTRVPKPPRGDKALRSWGHSQRDLFRRGLLPPERAARLDALGFAWTNAGPSPWQADALAAAWDAKFQLLVQFKEQHGHLRVPKRMPLLGQWTARQRRSFHHGTITGEQKTRLAALGFPSAAQPRVGPARAEYCERQWTAHFEQLRRFHERFGHLRVPKAWPEHPKLRDWLQRQRQAVRKGKITPQHQAQLAALGATATPAAPTDRE